MAIKRADLHTHTTASDGTRSPADVVRLAASSGLAAVAITDHDTMAGVAEAIEEGSRIGIQVVPGVEISASANGKDIHVLGYYPDWHNEVWLERLQQLRQGRALRNERIIGKLSQLGITITLEEVYAAAGKTGSDDETVGRPHIAAVLVDKGIALSVSEAFDTLLGSGKPGFVSVPRITPFEAVDWIREAGGTSIIAHPGLYGEDELVEELIRYGIGGVEVYHSDHSKQEEERYLKLARRYQVIETGGSDYHGERGGVVYHGGIGSRSVHAGVLMQLNPVWRKKE
ncbi:PHP domain-containing protein [Paenibacillus abyssi]|uniref:PHP-like protein n=1 Tax=Paenibacillus abyssi TaxID=1340531 RepID=A0A917D6S9_9BACL|nr:PHP domain-containing protein [Paenibacillus abyssi]GGG13039.1 PHP-like protein [Paenibacillus abyssi]